MSATEINGDVFKNNNYEFDFALTAKKTENGIREPATGLAGLVGAIHADDGEGNPVADPIHNDVRVGATERAETPGSYFGIISGSSITTRLFGDPSYDGKDVHIVLSKSDGSVRVHVKRTAYANRRIRPSR